MSPSATSTCSLNPSRDGDSPTALGSLVQCLIALPVKTFFPISNLKLPQRNWRPLTQREAIEKSADGVQPNPRSARNGCGHPLAQQVGKLRQGRGHLRELGPQLRALPPASDPAGEKPPAAMVGKHRGLLQRVKREDAAGCGGHPAPHVPGGFSRWGSWAGILPGEPPSSPSLTRVGGTLTT